MSDEDCTQTEKTRYYELSLFVGDLINFIIPDNTLRLISEKHIAFGRRIFDDDMRTAVSYLHRIYRKPASKLFSEIMQHNLIDTFFIDWFEFAGSRLFRRGLSYHKFLHFSVFLVCLASNFDRNGFPEALDTTHDMIITVLPTHHPLYDTKELHRIAQEYRYSYEGKEVLQVLYPDIFAPIIPIARVSLEISKCLRRSSQKIIALAKRLESRRRRHSEESNTGNTNYRIRFPPPDYIAVPGTSRDLNPGVTYPNPDEDQLMPTTSLRSRRCIKSELSESGSSKKAKFNNTSPNNQVKMSDKENDIQSEITRYYEFSLFISDLINFIVPDNTLSLISEKHIALCCRIFDNDMRKAVSFLQRIYRIHASKLFRESMQQNVIQIILTDWFGFILGDRLFRRGVSYHKFLHFSVFMVCLASILERHGFPKALDSTHDVITTVLPTRRPRYDIKELHKTAQQYASSFDRNEVVQVLHPDIFAPITPIARVSLETLKCLKRSSQKIFALAKRLVSSQRRHTVENNTGNTNSRITCPSLVYIAVSGTSRDTNPGVIHPNPDEGQLMSTTSLRSRRCIKNELSESGSSKKA